MISLTVDYILKQIEKIIPDGYPVSYNIEMYFDEAVNKTEICLKSLLCKEDKSFNYLVSWEYATFLYFLSRIIFLRTGSIEEPVRIFLLNKMLNGIDLFYEIDMPGNFFLGGHTVGMVFAKAKYSDFFVCYQNCTVGRNDNQRPVLEEGTVMFPGSMIIGKCHIKRNTVIAPGVKLVNTSTPGNCYVFNGKGGRVKFKELGYFYASKYFLC